MAQSEIGALRVRLAMDAGQFERGSKRAQRSANDMAKKLGKVMANIAAAAAAAAAALGRATQKIADEFDLLAKKADTFGISTDFFQSLQLGATEAGVSLGKLDSSLTAFAKRIGEARAGSGALVTTLKRMNPALLEGLKAAGGQEEALRLLADAMQNTESAADRAALASAAFSRAGVDMVRVLGQGSQGLSETADKARRLGVVVDSTVLRNFEKLNNEIGVDGRRIVRNMQQALVALGPVVKDVAAFVADLAQEVRLLVESFRPLEKRSKFALETELGSVTAKVDETIERMAALREERARARERGDLGRALTAEVQLKGARAELAVLKEQELAVAGRLEKLRQLDQVEQERAKRRADDGEQTPAVPGFDTEIVESQRLATETQRLWNEQVAIGTNLVAQTKGPMEVYREQIEALKAAQAEGVISANQFAAAQNRAAALVANQYLGLAGTVSGALESVFQESKGVAIASAIVNSLQAFTAALANPPGPPFSYAQAAAALASGFAQVQKIRSTNSSGSGGGSGAASATAPGGANGAGAQGAGGAAARQAVAINLQGEVFGRDQIRTLLERINEEVSDGARLVLT